MPVTAVDTSVAVPLLVTSHQQHAMVAEWANRERGAVLVTRDARARSIYEALGVSTEVLADETAP